MELTHRNLCLKAAKYLRSNGIYPFHRAQYSVCELERCGECPDAFGWGGFTQLIEVKVSRGDFLSDKRKYWRENMAYGLGQYRSYLCPENLINECDLPDHWGLLWIDETGKITVKITPKIQDCNQLEEINLVTSILRREGIRPQMFNYKNYKDSI